MAAIISRVLFSLCFFRNCFFGLLFRLCFFGLLFRLCFFGSAFSICFFDFAFSALLFRLAFSTRFFGSAFYKYKTLKTEYTNNPRMKWLNTISYEQPFRRYFTSSVMQIQGSFRSQRFNKNLQTK